METNVAVLSVGFLAQGFFSARVLVQWLLSERARSVLSPSVFWALSVAGAWLLCVYGWLRGDFAIVMGQLLSYYIYLWNLKSKGVWALMPLLLRWVLLLTPIVAVGWVANDADAFVKGFLCILENCRHHPVKQLIYASSSSVYGMKESTPLAETDFTDAPVSLYAATKKSDELMAYSYSRLYHIPATGVRFFTVYGPWGRPDMAPFLFLQSIMEGRKLRVFNYGLMQRDFTYIDDIVKGVMCIVGHPSTGAVPHTVYNIGHSSPVQLLDFIHTIEATTGKKAIMEKTGMQPGDVVCTYADTSRLRHDFGYSPQVSIDDGIKRFYDWYVDFYPSRARA